MTTNLFANQKEFLDAMRVAKLHMEAAIAADILKHTRIFTGAYGLPVQNVSVSTIDGTQWTDTEVRIVGFHVTTEVRVL